MSVISDKTSHDMNTNNIDNPITNTKTESGDQNDSKTPDNLAQNDNDSVGTKSTTSTTSSVTATSTITDDDETKDESKTRDTIDNDTTGQSTDKLNTKDHKIEIPKQLHKLNWDDIEFKDLTEKQGAMKLQEILHKDSKIPLNKLPPFEITRYYIGSFYDINLATRKWLDSIDMFKEHKFDSISDDDLEIFFGKISNVMHIGGSTEKNELVCSLACKSYIANNFQLNSTFIKAYFVLLHLLTSNLNVLRNGLILIGDCDQYSRENFTYQLVTRFALFQKVYPVRLSKIYIVNASGFVQTCFNIIKPLLTKFMQQRIFWMKKNVFQSGKHVDDMLIPDNILDGTFDSETINPMVKYCMEFMKNNNNLEHFKLDTEIVKKKK